MFFLQVQKVFNWCPISNCVQTSEVFYISPPGWLTIIHFDCYNWGMDLSSFRSLLTPSGQEALAAAVERQPREEDFLAHFTALSRRYPPGLARAALETAIYRAKAQAKFPFSGRLYFTREALEQASSWEVSSYRSERYRPFRTLFDLGCSIGGDTLALASLAPTTGVDLDPLRLRMAQANLQALGLARQAFFVQADLARDLPFSPVPRVLAGSQAIFFDPARRSQGKRAFTVQAYQPPLAIVNAWLERVPALGVKISPGVKLEELTGYDAEVEFISLQGELKEAVLWFGPLKTARRRAAVLPGPYALETGETGSPDLPLDEPGAFLYEPDPAILRAGLVTDLGLRLAAAQLDRSIAYLTAGRQIETPFARSWAVEDWFPFQLKRLRAYLRERGIGRVVVKKRGSPLEPEALIRDLRLKGDNEAVIFLTQLRGRPIVIVGRG
jgi:hypothetical protein